MPLLRILALLTLLVIFRCDVAHAQSARGDCKINLEVKLETSATGVSAAAEVQGAAQPVYYIYYFPDGRLINKDRDVSRNKIEGLKPGSYVCSVTDNRGCTAKVEFKVD